MKRRLTLFLALTAWSAGVVHPAAACATEHIQTKLDAFSEGSQSFPLYWATESAGQATFTIRILDATCDGSTSTINYEVQDASAGPADYSHAEQPITFVNSVGHPTAVQKTVTLLNDTFFTPPVEAPLETANIVITSTSNATIIAPSSAPLIIVDDDAPTPQYGLVPGTYEESETDAQGAIPVFRAGNAAAPTSVSYTVGGGTATAGSDYVAAASGQLTFQANDRMELIPIGVVDDGTKESSETVEVAIVGGDPSATSSVTFIIRDNEETLAPTSTLHHPRQRWKYRADDFRIREIHIFTKDVGSAGVERAEFALRRNLKSSCAWYTGKKFKKGSCDQERWLKTDQYEPDFFYIRMDPLKPSSGKIKDYTAYSRAIDGANNLEVRLETGRNANTFEIKASKGN